jgi:hypothetical protein
MSFSLAIFLPAAFGAAMQELIYWWQLRFKLNQKKYIAQIRSPIYWALVFAMIVASALGTVVWFSDHSTVARDCMIFGAAFPLIFKHTVNATTDSRRTLGGNDLSGHEVIRTYFDMR